MEIIGNLGVGSALDLRDGLIVQTFPFKVVAANSLASAGADESCSIACVVFHASNCCHMSSSIQFCGTGTHRFLKLFKEFMGIGFLFFAGIALHGRQSGKNWRIAARSVCLIGHGG